jgi:hypothetical protein
MSYFNPPESVLRQMPYEHRVRNQFKSQMCSAALDNQISTAIWLLDCLFDHNAANYLPLCRDALQFCIDRNQIDFIDAVLSSKKFSEHAQNLASFSSFLLAHACVVDRPASVKYLLSRTKIAAHIRLTYAYGIKWSDAVLDLVYQNPMTKIDPQKMPAVDRIAMIRTRLFDICASMAELDLPAYLTLKIVNAAIENSIKRFSKWTLIVLVKNAHRAKQGSDFSRGQSFGRCEIAMYQSTTVTSGASIQLETGAKEPDTGSPSSQV